ncbi:hypothetical protein B0H16DRAFT_1468285 [Mycena metata]|uniref:Uncharacterized protein n=1 Tax=Mycena metata TaxID=1033252 RepID=A0AAD7I1H8_9AGAR|nr:hypothetical protein B0H16DRAFT_1468285 [Mycena metata]
MSPRSTLASQPRANKLQRRNSDADVDRPADRNTDPRETPRVRKSYQPSGQVSIHALVLAGPSALNTTTADTFSPESSDDEIDLPARSPSPTPAPSTSALSPPPHSPAQSDMSLEDDEMNGQPPVVPLAPAPPVVQPLLPPQQQIPAAPAPQFNAAPAPAGPVQPANAAQAFVLPSEAALVAHRPPCRADNPYLKFPAVQPPPPLNPEMPAHYVPTSRAARHWSPAFTKRFEEKAGKHLIGILANGGNHLRNTQFDTPLLDQAKAAIRVRALTDDIEVKFPVPVSLDGIQVSTDKYGGPIALSIIIDTPANAAGPLAQGTYGGAPLPGILGALNDPTDIVAWARAGFVLKAIEDPDAFREVDQATQALGGDSRQRVFDALNTIHAEFLPHKDRPVVVFYMKLISAVPKVQERVAQALRRLEFTSGEYGFRPRSKGNPSECVLCKMSNHPTFLCRYSDSNIVPGPPPSTPTTAATTTTGRLELPPAGEGPGETNAVETTAMVAAGEATTDAEVEADVATHGRVDTPEDTPAGTNELDRKRGRDKRGGEREGEVYLRSGSASQQSWHAGYQTARSHEARREVPSNPMIPRQAADDLSRRSSAGEIEINEERLAVVGEGSGSATGHAFNEHHRDGGDRAEGRSEANRDGYHPPGEESPRRANEERLDATPAAMSRPGGAIGTNALHMHGAVRQQHPSLRGGGTRGADVRNEQERQDVSNEQERQVDRGRGGMQPPTGNNENFQNNNGSPFLRPVLSQVQHADPQHLRNRESRVQNPQPIPGAAPAQQPQPAQLWVIARQTTREQEYIQDQLRRDGGTGQTGRNT